MRSAFKHKDLNIDCIQDNHNAKKKRIVNYARMICYDPIIADWAEYKYKTYVCIFKVEWFIDTVYGNWKFFISLQREILDLEYLSLFYNNRQYFLGLSLSSRKLCTVKFYSIGMQSIS